VRQWIFHPKVYAHVSAKCLPNGVRKQCLLRHNTDYLEYRVLTKNNRGTSEKGAADMGDAVAEFEESPEV